MSLEKWKKQYWKKFVVHMSGSEAVQVDLGLFRGLRPDALAEHGLHLEAGLRGDVSVTAGGLGQHRFYPAHPDNLALCAWTRSRGKWCTEECPLRMARSGIRCYRDRKDTDDGTVIENPDQVFKDTQNPEPMIAWLEKAAEVPEHV